MQKNWTRPNEFFTDFSNASPEALDQILSALNAEVDRAIGEKRFPTLDGAYQFLGTTPGYSQ